MPGLERIQPDDLFNGVVNLVVPFPKTATTDVPQVHTDMLDDCITHSL